MPTIPDRYKALKANWDDWGKNPETFGPWIAPPGDLPWLFEVFIPACLNRIAALQDKITGPGPLRSRAVEAPL